MLRPAGTVLPKGDPGAGGLSITVKPSAPVHLAARRYGEYIFHAQPGDQIEITVRGQGMPQAFFKESK
jgi:hypothetical protein